jgi:hypothetical protein
MFNRMNCISEKAKLWNVFLLLYLLMVVCSYLWKDTRCHGDCLCEIKPSLHLYCTQVLYFHKGKFFSWCMSWNVMLSMWIEDSILIKINNYLGKKLYLDNNPFNLQWYILWNWLQSQFDNDRDYYKLLGYIESEGGIESTDDYVSRMSAYVTLYAAIIQVSILTQHVWIFTGCFLVFKVGANSFRQK